MSGKDEDVRQDGAEFKTHRLFAERVDEFGGPQIFSFNLLRKGNQPMTAERMHLF